MIDSFVLEILARHLPAAEQEEMMHRAKAYADLEKQIREFEHAIELVEHSHALKDELVANHAIQETTRPIAWMRIAARDAALAIYHFGWALEIFRSRIQKIPTVRQYLDVHASRQANRRFNDDFNGHRDMRHAVAHWTEDNKTPEDAKKNRLGGVMPIESIFSWENRSLTVFRDGKPVSVALTWENLQRLREIAALAASAYEPVLKAVLPDKAEFLINRP